MAASYWRRMALVFAGGVIVALAGQEVVRRGVVASPASSSSATVVEESTGGDAAILAPVLSSGVDMDERAALLEKTFRNDRMSDVQCEAGRAGLIQKRIDAAAKEDSVGVAALVVECGCVYCRLEFALEPKDEKRFINRLLSPGGVLQDLIVDATYVRPDVNVQRGRVFGRSAASP